MSELCCERDSRREDVREAGLNGLDYIEVSDDQRTLTVTFLGKAPDEIAPANVVIEGGRRVTQIKVIGIRFCREDDPDVDDCMHVRVDRPGDFSQYTLRLVDPAAPGFPFPGFDARYSQLSFSFKVGCPSELDCAAAPPCPPHELLEPEIPYLAKDYASFRTLLLDRLAALVPDWHERHVPDIGLALVELLAYVGDYLSYHQDAVATEAYLDTARRRISVRRHARLVDYRLHDGCNARAWVCVEVDEPLALEPGEACFVAAPATTGLPAGALDCDGLRTLSAVGAAVFEPLGTEQTRLEPAHNTIGFWTWGDDDCCLAAGSTSATLRDAWSDEQGCEGEERPRTLRLHPGDLLIFEERIGPGTGNPADSDPAHRQAVRLTAVTKAVDKLYDQPVLEITWGPQDALDFPLCISTFAGEDCAPIDGVSVACGNVLLVDHGATIGWCDGKGEPLPDPEVDDPDPICAGPCEPGARLPRPRPYAPALQRHPVTQRTPFPKPQSLAQREAEIIGAIPGRVHARLRELVRFVRAGDRLDDEMRAELTALFGARTLADYGLARARTAAQELEALERLVGHADHLLADKERRTRALAVSALAGDVLPPIVTEELEELWGARYLVGAQLGSGAQSGPARGTLEQDAHDALPAVSLEQRAAGPPPLPARARRRRPAPSTAEEPALIWEPHHDVLASGPEDRHFVGELDDDGVLRLRFGIGGHEPELGTQLTARYRIGNGRTGNVGREAISRIVLRTVKGAGVARVRNPLPARGGIDPEPLADVKLQAPASFRRRLERAVTAEDYTTLAQLVPGVQRAATRLRWTGSWYEAHVGLDLLSAGRTLWGDVPAAVTARLARARRLGHDLRVEVALPAPLDVALTVCVAPEHRQGRVRAALLDALSDRVLGNGQRGLFHPDRLTFGSGIAMSTLVAAAQAVPGVELVQVRRLRRLHGPGDDIPASGVLALGPLEIPELANDPNDPERGRLTLELRGGR
jgi:hypothetical protein